MTDFDNECDRCHARAQVRVSRMNSLLQFCNHHFLLVADALQAQGWSISYAPAGDADTFASIIAQA